MSDRILVLSKGEVVAEFEGDEATEKELVDASAMGHGPAAMSKETERGTSGGDPVTANAQAARESRHDTDRGRTVPASGTCLHRAHRVGLVIFAMDREHVPDRRQHRDPHQADGAQRHPRHRHDLRHPDRRHRPLGRLDRGLHGHHRRPAHQRGPAGRRLGRSSRIPGWCWCISLAAGTVLGAISGFIITRFNVAPFIATLGMLMVARGLAGLINNGKTYPNLVGKEELGNTGFRELGTGSLLGVVPWAIVILVVFALVAWFVTTRTPFGRAVYAVGGNERSAELSGVRVNRTKMIVYMISAFCAATVGLIIASQLVAAHPATGQYFELYAIAAVVLGGTSLAGGRGTIVGTIIGALVIGTLNNGLTLMGISSLLEADHHWLRDRARSDHRPTPAACRAAPGPAATGGPGRQAYPTTDPTIDIDQHRKEGQQEELEPQPHGVSGPRRRVRTREVTSGGTDVQQEAHRDGADRSHGAHRLDRRHRVGPGRGRHDVCHRPAGREPILRRHAADRC